jgi:hypothetical protein
VGWGVVVMVYVSTLFSDKPLASLVLPNGKATKDARGKPDGRVHTYLNLRFGEGHQTKNPLRGERGEGRGRREGRFYGIG